MADVNVDVEVDEFVDSCSKREIKELIDYLVDEGHLPESVLDSNGNIINIKNSKISHLEQEFIDNVDKLKGKFYSLSSEDEGEIMKIIKKYI
jgi:hypothetical protein